MIFNLSSSSDNKLQEFYTKAMKELGDFYEINWNRNKPAVFLVNSREDINKLKGRETEDWVVGFTDGSKSCIFLLNTDNYESESSHKYSDEEYFALMKHELSHLFSRILYVGYKPVWLTEGIAIYSSGQIELKKKPRKFKLFLDYFDSGGSGLYNEAGFAVEILIREFGKEKFFKFYKNLDKIDSEEDLNVYFKKSYKTGLSYDFFNEYLEL